MKSTVVGVAVGLVVGVGIGWMAFKGGAAPAMDDAGSKPAEIDAVRAELARKDTELETAHREVQNQARDAGTAKRRIEELEAAVAAAKEETAAALAAKPTADAAPETDAVDPADAWKKPFADGPVFDFDEFHEALTDVDWPQMATDMHAMVGLISHLVESGQKGEQPRADTYGSIQEHNGRLVTVFVKLSRNNVPGSEMNGAITHPSVMANAIAATLAASKLPLDAAQSKKLEELARTFVAGDQRRLAGYDDTTFALRKRVEEAKLKAEFFTAAFALLTPEQRDALSPETIRGRTRADLFSEGLLWVGNVQPLEVKDAADLVTKVTEKVASQLGPDDTVTKDEVQAVVKAWADGVPSDVLSFELDALGKQGMWPAADVTRSAQHTLALYEKLAADLPLSAATRAKLFAAEAPFLIYASAP